MRAVVQEGYGGPEVIRVAEVPEPVPGPRDAAIRVHAAGVHAGDVRIMRGEPLMIRAVFGRRRPRKPVIGRDVVGTVVAVGSEVDGFAVGDRVFTEADQGGFAEVVVVDAPHVRRAPANLDDEHAAVIPVSGTTALQGLRLAKAAAGDRVLVIGASGGVGTYTVQLAAGLGAEVTGVASAAKADHVRAAGATHVIDYRTTDVTEQGERYDVVFDLVGDHPLRAMRRILAPHGTLVLSSGGGTRVLGPLGRIVRASLLDLFTRQRLRPLAARRDGDDLDELRRLAEEGTLRPVVDRVMPIDRAADALALLESGAVRGKIALRGFDHPGPAAAADHAVQPSSTAP
ncbi:NADPH:quinone reductase-like Zn-dependent oxidoreductase [Agromyces flavus]|uniref:NADPH:quinone reductase n=1 Tax=Agromyces flavus TaxID=589382 RepID=A0A1H1MRQ7_9MICO|nr:NAD(P)-dependent alcohol dehydrogenase [Agromyces flavus]MCP2369219.1 NADPH:quinone reductase-like Zn-dependent oxidoreductase [Agromyces flavus]GGI48700.1 NADPH:quinone reductase [Agromyces flavus]SDR89541.1 NADPH:quinone reductase [Agromyces flavus]